MPRALLVVAGAALALYLLVLAFSVGAVEVPRAPVHDAAGDPERGLELVSEYGCGGCHVIPGAPRADGRVGPSLADFAARANIAGRLPNREEELVRWIVAPQRIAPGTAMPDLDVTPGDAADIAAYLYSLR